MASALTVPEPSRAKILLVDDQPGRLMTYHAILDPLEEELVDARSGLDALKLLMQDEYAVILLDVNMPGMDGFETASLIHQHPRFENTPIIFVTAVNVSDLDRLRGYKLGAVDYIMVPVIPEIMRSKVSVLVELYRKRRELQAINDSLSAANQTLQLEKARELEQLNASLREANEALAARNMQLLAENAERVKAEERLREADQRKNEFLATLAHELRNPLAPLQNALALRRLGAPGEADPLLGLMERQVALLVRLIDDLFDIARISRGKLQLKRSRVVLQDAIAVAIDSARPWIDQGRHEFKVQMPEEPIYLDADQARLSQVFANLLNNAAKYSDAAGRIELGAERDGDGIRVWVSDQGIGLAADQLDRVFDSFHQVDVAVERSQGGLGIGLTLVQRLAEMHDGRVEVTSEGIGQGCTFTVRLPDNARDVAPPAAAQAGPAKAATAPRRMLVVDDNRDSADTLAAMLRMLGQDARAIYDPMQVEDVLRSFDPAVMFLDVGMPGRSGYDIARSVREAGASELVIVAVTGWGQPEDRERTSTAGFDHHLVKPPEIAAIQDICQQRGRPPRPEKSP
ncbi:response regulator [Lysobacter sp. GCM10012299]|uniref:response regulator n=1 Tax=Lysobacter sp. GCM10012299 TaxID=3317333 RepID=UPI0036152A31